MVGGLTAPPKVIAGVDAGTSSLSTDSVISDLTDTQTHFL